MLTPDDLKRLETFERQHPHGKEPGSCESCWAAGKLRSSNEALERVKALCNHTERFVEDEQDGRYPVILVSDIRSALEGTKP